MGRSKSSHRWLREHFDDAWVKRAQKEGYRSRAVYKLQEIDERDRLIRPGMTIVDLGAAPGGWSQYAAKRLNGRGRVIALDILPMDSIAGVEVLEGDFTEQAALDDLLALLGDSRVDLVLSDMAPNLSGNRVVDQPRAMYLAELALDLAERVLRPGGDFLTKVFQGEGIDDFRARCKGAFGKLITRKPQASRPRSTEQYLLARDYRGGV
ncbi:MAG TPA: 23S rRNA (uridine(2552)-2'-O)-methyltransferase RlmE [Gammaproteobacteria bacterium]|nr:23S rRNA (uridine(2552)-2'-O)-methyltransferase RlmE [Gammaproteobacteria bacterium]